MGLRTFGLIALLIGLATIGAGLVWAFSDTQSATGSLNATSASVDLYICEASSSIPGPPCAADDSNGDEIIFEGLEDLIPGQVAEWDLRLVNQGQNPWDILDFSPAVAIASDPGSDCGTLLTGDPVLGFAAVLPKLGIGAPPTGMAVNSNTGRIYVAAEQGDLYVIDEATNSVVATVDLGPGPRNVGVNSTTNRVYVIAGGILFVMDGSTNTVIDSLSGYSGNPAVNPVTNRIYAAASGGMSVIDGATNTVITTVAVSGSHIAVNPITNRVYVLAGSVVSVVDGASNAVVDTVSIGVNATGIALNSTTNRIYTANQQLGSVSVIDGGTNSVVTTVDAVFNAVVSGPHLGISTNPATNRIYVSDGQGDQVAVIDGSTNSLTTPIPVGDGPHPMTINSSTGQIHVGEYVAESMSTIDGATDSVVAVVSAIGSDNDNHSPLSGFPTLPRTDSGTALSVHVGPADYEDIRVFVMLPFAAPSGCADAAWDVSVSWTSQIHAP